MKIVVIGGSGLIGTKLVSNLRQLGHEVVAASRSSGINTLTGEGLDELLVGAEVVVDVANSPSFEDKPVMEFFETGGRNLLAAETGAGVADIAVREPLNGMIELAGPEPIPLDELVRRFLGANRDARMVTTDVHPLYFGMKINDQSLTPGDNPRIGPDAIRRLAQALHTSESGKGSTIDCFCGNTASS